MTSEHRPSLAASGLHVAYRRTPVVRGVDLDVQAGEVLALVGPNGSGKSTVLRALARLHASSAGEVTLNGSSVGALSPRDFARQVTLMSQQHGRVSGMTVRDVVELGRHPHRRLGRPDPRGREVVAHALDRAGVAHVSERPVDELSGGELQRVWLATALAQETGVLLLDEPTNHLDLRHQVEVLDLLHDLAREGVAVGVVLHDLNQAAALADRVALLSAGQVVACGHPNDVLTVEHLSEAYGVPVTVHIDDATGALTTRVLGRHCRDRTRVPALA